MTTESWIAIIAAGQAAHILVHICLRIMDRVYLDRVDEAAKDLRVILERAARVEKRVHEVDTKLCAERDKATVLCERLDFLADRSEEQRRWILQVLAHVATLAGIVNDEPAAQPPTVFWRPK